MDTRIVDNKPIYMQIMDNVKAAVASGELKPGQKVLSVRDMAKEFEVNPNTMQRALNELEREGILLSERTAGRFVTEDTALIEKLRYDMAREAVERFKTDMKVLGFSSGEIKNFFGELCQEMSSETYGEARIG